MTGAVVCATIHGTVYYLTKHPREFAPERETAAVVTADEARVLADTYGGNVVLLDQVRTVEGTIGRSNDRGPRA